MVDVARENSASPSLRFSRPSLLLGLILARIAAASAAASTAGARYPRGRHDLTRNARGRRPRHIRDGDYRQGGHPRSPNGSGCEQDRRRRGGRTARFAWSRSCSKICSTPALRAFASKSKRRTPPHPHHRRRLRHVLRRRHARPAEHATRPAQLQDGGGCCSIAALGFRGGAVGLHRIGVAAAAGNARARRGRRLARASKSPAARCCTATRPRSIRHH